MAIRELFACAHVHKSDAVIDQVFYFIGGYRRHAKNLAEVRGIELLSSSMSSSDSVQFVPLGGLGEIGMNSFALQDGASIILVDCGATFPDDDWGVDLLYPDFRWLLERQARLDGIVITHGHEDHIGALPYLLRKLDAPVPIHAPAHAAALIRERLAAHGLSRSSIHVMAPGSELKLGSFSIEPVPVAHSIIDAVALSIQCSAGRILHTADFNLDEEQPAGHLTDSYRLTQLGEAGVRLLLSDSTNIGTPERERHEGDVAVGLTRLVESGEKRVVVAMFSSNVHRLLALGRAAQASGRRLCLLGRSLKRHFEIASVLGRLPLPSNLLVAPEDARGLAREKLLVLAGGSQGEVNSALRKLSRGQHPQLELEAGDLVAFSSRIIPGNERAVFSLVNDLERLGVEIRTPNSHPNLHTSGHASRQELQTMLEWTCPTAFMPVHGTLSHLRAHEALARSLGVEETLIVENGQVVEVPAQGPLRVVDSFRAPAVQVALGGRELSEAVYKQRVELGRQGSLFFSASLDARGRQVGETLLTAHGVPGLEEDAQMQSLQRAAEKALVEAPVVGMISLEERVGRALRSRCYSLCGVKPVVKFHVHLLPSTSP